MKLKLGILITAAIVLITASCSDNGTDSPEPDPDAVRVAGKYEAIELVTIGDNGIPVFHLDYGAFIEMELFLDFGVEGVWSIPESNNYHNGFDTTAFSGTYKVKGDSLQFSDLQNIISRDYYLIKDDTLEFIHDTYLLTRIKLVKN